MPNKEIVALTGSIFFLVLPGSTFYCDTPLQSFLIALLPDSIFVSYTSLQFI